MSEQKKRGAVRIRMPRKFDAIGLADQVSGTRLAFARIYDEHAALAGNRDARESALKFRPFMVVSVGCHDDREAFRRAFAEAHSARWSRELVIACVAAGLLPAGSSTSGLGGSVELQRGTVGSEVVTQAVINSEAGYIDAAAISPGGIEATQRLCKITVTIPEPSGPKQVTGSGFLVGPQTILTAWHVLEHYIEPIVVDGRRTGKAKPNSQHKITVEFDDLLRPAGARLGGLRSKFGLAPDWLIDGSPFHPEERPQCGKPGKWPTPLRGLNGYYDFAVVKLDGTPGLERGHYKLDAAYPFNAGDYLLVFQHPSALKQRAAVTQHVRYIDKANKWRLGHRANTSAGSSGGVCLDKNFNVIALHQADISRGWNGAIPVARIAEQVGTIDTIDQEYSTVTRLLDGTPIFGRQKFQRYVWQLVRGESRFLVASRPPRQGNSFCYDIMERLLPAERHVVWKLNSVDVPTDAAELARRMLAVLEREPLGQLPKFTTDAAWIKNELLPSFSSRFNAATKTRMFWVVLDRLRQSPLESTDGSAFLRTLYDNIITMPSLRFVFLELTAAPRGANRDLVLADIDDDHVEDPVAGYLMRMHKKKLSQAGPTQANLLASIVKGLGAARGDGGLGAVQQIVKESIDPFLDGGNETT
jgi:hypothetical protein